MSQNWSLRSEIFSYRRPAASELENFSKSYPHTPSCSTLRIAVFSHREPLEDEDSSGSVDPPEHDSQQASVLQHAGPVTVKIAGPIETRNAEHFVALDHSMHVIKICLL